MSRTKASLGVIAATAVTALTFFLLPFTPRLAVRSAVISRGDLVKSARLEGVVAYRKQLPAVSLQAGRLTAVHVREGQRVEKGQLLFALDATEEEQALAALAASRYAQEQALGDYGAAAALVLAREAPAWEEKELALRRSIAAKRLRADGDGVVEAVCVGEGEYVAAGALLGVVRGEETCVMAVSQAGEQARAGMAALLTLGNDASVPARLEAVSAPEDGETGARRLCFVPLDGAALGTAGRRAMVELVNDIDRDVPLAPLEAVDSADRLWVIADGIATPIAIDTERRNGEYVRVPESLMGARVILSPQEDELTPGRAVKEARMR